jgi:hypothetical protein
VSAALKNRELGGGFVFASGLVAGVICYFLAESLIPSSASSPGDHDLALANRLGYIYTPVVGVWLGWIQKSWRRALIGAGIGIMIGIVYMILCASRNFIAIMVTFPCLLGGGLAAFAGSNRSEWLAGFGWRLGKGLLAGFVLGLVYMVVLNVLFGLTMSLRLYAGDFAKGYVATMWRIGPVALGISSALFLILIRWAVGLTRARILIFEEVN